MASPNPDRADGTAAFHGLVLTGGASRRFGSDKAFALVDGEPMVLRVVAALRGAGAVDVVAIGGDRSRLADLGVRAIEDRWPGEGPLAGLLAGLDALADDARPASEDGIVVLAACDLPRLRPRTVADLVRHLLATGAAVAVPVVDGERQPHLLAVRRSCTGSFAGAFDGGVRSLRRAIATVEVAEIDVGRSSAIDRTADLTDADTPLDLAEAARVADGEDER